MRLVHSPTRARLLEEVALRLLALPADRIHRIAIDGVDGAGKTVFADELAHTLIPAGRPVIRASVDGFHHPRAHRYRRGRHSPEGFFYDSYDYERLQAELLAPLAPGGSRRYRTAAFDHYRDMPVTMPQQLAPPDALLLLDGIFLHRPELLPCWEYSIFIEVAFATSVPRGAARDGTAPDPDDPSQRRYVEGQRLYLRTCQPQHHATLIVNNDLLELPYLEP